MFVRPATGPGANHVPETSLLAGEFSSGPQLTVAIARATAAMPSAREIRNLYPGLRIMGMGVVRESCDAACERGKWALQDSNLRPSDYESAALTD